MRYIRKVAPDCPADLFIGLYKNADKSPRKVTFSKRAINFFRKHADFVTINGKEIKFEWDADDVNPELKVDVMKKRKRL